MPLTEKSAAVLGPPSPTALRGRSDDDLKDVDPALKLPVDMHLDLGFDPNGPVSPRVRKRLDQAKENANVFGPVCEQGEVIQWMSACHSGLIAYGESLERRGFKTLSSIAFLTEEELDPSIDPAIRQLLLSTLARLRHELFRM